MRYSQRDIASLGFIMCHISHKSPLLFRNVFKKSILHYGRYGFQHYLIFLFLEFFFPRNYKLNEPKIICTLTVSRIYWENVGKPVHLLCTKCTLNLYNCPYKVHLYHCIKIKIKTSEIIVPEVFVLFYFGVKYRVLQYVLNENVTFTTLFKP